MRRFDFHPHTADVRLFVEADSMPELFTGALEGMAEFLLPAPGQTPANDALPRVEREIDIISVDRSALLVEFLSEVLYHSNTAHAVFREVRFTQIDDVRVRAVITGWTVSGFADDIKAVTYREAEIRNSEGRLTVTVLFDI